ncbi:hypothetical protein H6P81_018699 [Aristolochia fimbriata]|uniref:Uncharacterized protein n=1 Tax=Aristolochia fimbriata TaxID=158543 RepID=A0AAV7E1R9_ARIFI|nr:hypothetical protein H6P81_018699 [Aristolochia fimbriata]
MALISSIQYIVCSQWHSHSQYKGHGGHQDARKTAKLFHPSIWGDHFLTHSPLQTKVDEWSGRAEKLKKQGKRKLWDARGSKQREMQLVDDLQRLGIGYHFEEEIEDALFRMYKSFYSDVAKDDDLKSVALRFRLLRQAGYYVSATEAFTKFKYLEGKKKINNKNNFRGSSNSNSSDMDGVVLLERGLLNLYEAAFLSIPGEDILDKAITFSSEELRSRLPNMQMNQPHFAERVRRALDLPFYRGLPRYESMNYISFYQEEEGRDEGLLELAKLDFNLVQSLHQRDLRQITTWWKELGLAEKLPFARDRAVELFYWTSPLHDEPKHSRRRIIMNKLANLFSATDDIYDVYGNAEELQLLTDAIEKWELGAMEGLPTDCIKAYYRALLDTVREIEDELITTSLGQSNYQLIPYLKAVIKETTRAYLQESKWCKSGDLPSVEEHLGASLVTAGYSLLPITSLLGMEDNIVTREALEWLRNMPRFMKASATISRIRDDIATHKFEQERDHVASTVECYMKENGVSEEEACRELMKMVADAWKELNEGLLRPTPFPRPILTPSLQLARIAEHFYRNGDSFTHADGETKQNIASLYLNPIPV